MYQDLSAQEKREADSLVLMWQSAQSQAAAFGTLAKDVEEAVLAPHMKAKEAGVLHRELEKVVKCLEELFVDFQKARAESMQNPEYFRGHLVLPEWIDKKFKTEYLAKLNAAASHRGNITSAFVGLLSHVITHTPQSIEPSMVFLRSLLRLLKNLEEGFAKSQANVRHLLKMYGAQDAKEKALNFLRCWASSPARAKYLESRGVYLGARVVGGVQIVSAEASTRPPESLRRRKAKAANGTEKEPEASQTVEEPWTFVLVNFQGKELARVPELLSGDGYGLKEILDQNVTWPPSADMTISKLRVLLTTSPKDRTKEVFRHLDQIWYKLRFAKKWRMLARASDSERTVYLIAGHRTNVYAGIGRSKNEK